VNSTQQFGGVDTLQIHYQCTYTGQTCDINRWVDRQFAEQPGGVYARGFMYVHVNPGGTVSPGVQRKRVWIDDGDGGNFDWAFILNAWWAASEDNKLHLSATANVGSPCAPWQDWNLAELKFDTWYEIEVYVQPDTGGLSNGRYRVWVNGVEVSYPTTNHTKTMCLRGNNTTGIKSVSWGRQADKSSNRAGDIDEYTYWTRMEVATGYIP
jgi:hypothetical protein